MFQEDGIHLEWCNTESTASRVPEGSHEEIRMKGRLLQKLQAVLCCQQKVTAYKILHLKCSAK